MCELYTRSATMCSYKHGASVLLTSMDGASNDLMTAVCLIREGKGNQFIALHEFADGAKLHLRSAGYLEQLQDGLLSSTHKARCEWGALL